MADPNAKPTITLAEHAQFRNIPEDKLVKMIAMQNDAQIKAIDPITPPEQWIRQNQNSELVQKALDKLYPTSKIVGYGNGKAMTAAIDAARTSGQKFTFIGIDGNNFGGMAKQTNSPEQTRAHEKAMIDITKNALAKQGLDVQVFRPTPELVGDEYGMVVKGDPKKVAAGLEAAKAEIAEYAKANGLNDLPYRKEGGPSTKSASLEFATEDITADKTAKQVVDNAEAKLKASKSAPAPVVQAEPVTPVRPIPSLEPPKPGTIATEPVVPVEPVVKPVVTTGTSAKPLVASGPVSRIPELKAGRGLGVVGVVGGGIQIAQSDGNPYRQAEGTTKVLSGAGMVFKPRAAGPLFIVQSTIETGIAATEGYEKDGTKGALKQGGHKVAEIGTSLIMYTPETFGHMGDWGGHVASGDWGAAKKSSDDLVRSTLPGKLGDTIGQLVNATRDYNNAKDANEKMLTRSLDAEGKAAFRVTYDDVGGYRIGPAEGSPLGSNIRKLKDLKVIPEKVYDYKTIEAIVSAQLKNPSPALRGEYGGIAAEYEGMLKASANDLRMIYATEKQAKETGSVIRFQSKENTRDSIAMFQEYLRDTPPDKFDKQQVNAMLSKLNERMKQFGYSDYALKGETFSDANPAVDPTLSIEKFRQKALTRTSVMNAALMPQRAEEFVPSKQLTEAQAKAAALKVAREEFVDLPDLLEKAVKQVPVNGRVSVDMKEIAAKVEKLNAALVKAGKEPLKVSFDIKTLTMGDPKAFAADPRFAELQQSLDKVAKESFGFAGVRSFSYSEQDEAILKQTRGPAQEALKAELAELQKDGGLTLYERGSGEGYGGVIQFMKDGKPDTSPEAMAKLEKAAQALVASNTGFSWMPEAGRINISSYTFPDPMIAKDKQMKAERWQKKSAAAAEVARVDLLVMAAQGKLTFAQDGSAILNLQSMDKWQDRRETQILLATAALSPAYAPPENTPVDKMLITVEIDGRRTQVPALDVLRLKPESLGKDGVSFKDMAEAAAFVGAQERIFREAKMELPDTIKTVAAKLKKGGGELSGDEIAAMVAFKKNPPPEVRAAADAALAKAKIGGDANTKDHNRDMVMAVLDQFKKAAATGDVSLLMKLNTAVVDMNKKSGNNDITQPKTYATLGNLQKKIDFLNDGLAQDDPKYIDLKKIMGDKPYDLLKQAMKMNDDTLQALTGGPNAPPLTPKAGVAPSTPSVPGGPDAIKR